MRTCTLTVVVIAEDDAGLRRRILEINQVPGVEVEQGALFEDADLDDEDNALGHEEAGKRRAMDALHRLAQPLLNEIATEVRDGPANARANGYEDDADSEITLREHISDMFRERVDEVLVAEYAIDGSGELDLAWAAVVDWAFGPHALDDVWLDQKDCDEIKAAYLVVYLGEGPPMRESAISQFCYEGGLVDHVPRLAAHADEAYEWLIECAAQNSWLSAPENTRSLVTKPPVG